jgi:hypothetical protein
LVTRRDLVSELVGYVSDAAWENDRVNRSELGLLIRATVNLDLTIGNSPPGGLKTQFVTNFRPCLFHMKYSLCRSFIRSSRESLGVETTRATLGCGWTQALGTRGGRHRESTRLHDRHSKMSTRCQEDRLQFRSRNEIDHAGIPGRKPAEPGSGARRHDS